MPRQPRCGPGRVGAVAADGVLCFSLDNVGAVREGGMEKEVGGGWSRQQRWGQQPAPQCHP